MFQKGDLVKWHKDWSPDTERLDACKIGVVLEKGNNHSHWPTWWVYFAPHRMILYEEDLEKVNVVQDN